MRSIGVREFRDQATSILAAGETLVIERHGEPIGFFVPIVATDRQAGREALGRLGKVVEDLMARSVPVALTVRSVTTSLRPVWTPPRGTSWRLTKPFTRRSKSRRWLDRRVILRTGCGRQRARAQFRHLDQRQRLPRNPHCDLDHRHRQVVARATSGTSTSKPSSDTYIGACYHRHGTPTSGVCPSGAYCKRL